MDLVEFLRARLYADDEPRAERLLGIDNAEADRQLAEVEAKREILRRYAEYAEYDDVDNSYEHATGRIVGLGEAVRLLALPYVNHPDYRNEWKP